MSTITLSSLCLALSGLLLIVSSVSSDTKNKNNKGGDKVLKSGDKALIFSAKTYGGKTVSLKDYVGKKNVVLYFYPKDDTPGCTKEACSFRDNIQGINDENTVVIGVSVDDIKSHEKFKNKYNLNFDLVSDEEHKIIEMYGVKRVKDDKVIANRVTFLIDKKGIIRFIWNTVNAEGHAVEVLEKIGELGL